jgi:N-hydroxyarylamine O-acetyltransferase
MDKTDIFKKLVTEERGGYCLETNLLLRSALLSLGFEIRLRAARVWMRIAPVYTPMDPPLPRLHIVLLVRTSPPPGGGGGGGGGDTENKDNNNQTEWLVDCGFGGGGPSDPIPFRTGVEISSGGDLFRLDAGSVALGEDSIVLMGVRQGVWERLYSFEHSHWDSPIVHVSDLLLVSYFVQSAQGTLFFKMRVVTKPLPDGRLTLLNNELRRRGKEQLGQVPSLEVSSIGNAEELCCVARDNFNIKLTVEEAEKIFNASVV